MGKALYREYRPKRLADVVGQEHITTVLSNALKKNVISHAYLFTGPRGVGKTSIARILAHELNNVDYDETKTHLDIIEIDAASNRRIDEIRDLREKVHIAPSVGPYKIYIIDEVHMLTREAFNALLKTLEEPPEHAVFILATTEAHKVPDTIISRTQRFHFKQIAAKDAVKHLKHIAQKEKIAIDDSALELLATHGGGSFRDSISMLDQLHGLSNDTISTQMVRELLGVPEDAVLEQIIDAVTRSNIAQLFNEVQKLRELGVNPAKAVQSLIQLLRDKVLESPSSELVSLMKELLPLTGTYSSYEALEIVLLDACSTPSQVPRAREIETSSPPTESAKIEKKPVETAESESDSQDMSKTQEVAEVAASVTAPITSDNDINWTDILNKIKTERNTLYGVLRMAQSHYADDTLTLTFEFEFHKKQVAQNKNLDIIKKIMKESHGREPAIELIVTAKQQKKPTTQSQESGSLSSVSNIFGGAELLES